MVNSQGVRHCVAPYTMGVVLAGLLVLNGCSDSSQPTGLDATHGGIAVMVRFPQAGAVSNVPEGRALVAALGAPKIDCTGLGIGVITIQVLTSGGTLVGQGDFSCQTGEGSLTGIPAGTGYQVTVSGRPYQGGPPVYEGTTPNVSVSPASTTSVEVSPTAQFTSLKLQPASLKLQRKQTVAFERIITAPEDVGQQVGLETVSFSSSNTAIAAVSGGGEVTAISQGSANILVTLGNVSTSVPVTVVPGFGFELPTAPFILSAASSSPTSRLLAQGTSATFQLVAIEGSSTSSINLNDVCPVTLTCSLGQSSVIPGSGGGTPFTVQVTAGPSSKPGVHLIPVTGTQSGGVSRTLTLCVIVLPPSGPLPEVSGNSQLRVSPATRSVRISGPSSSYTVELTTIGGANGPGSLTLGVTGCPPNTSCVFDPPSVIPIPGGSTSTLAVTALPGAIAGFYPLVITAGAAQGQAYVMIKEGVGGRFLSMPPMPGGPRDSHTATPLTTGVHAGKVLIVGGLNNGVPLSTVLLYSPSTGTWESGPSLPSAITGLANHTATLLEDGKVLVAGGQSGLPLTASRTCLLFQTFGSWSQCGSSMITPRAQHEATLITDGPQRGMVLVTGGVTGGGVDTVATDTAELFANTFGGPGTDSGRWFSVIDPGVTSIQTAVGLPTGSVLVVGYGGTKAELYVPLTGTPSPTGQWNSTVNSAVIGTPGAGGAHSSITLKDGRILTAGSLIAQFANAYLYDPNTNTWSPTGSLPLTRHQHSITGLADGKVILIGGFHMTSVDWQSLFNAVLYDPSSGTWQDVSQHLYTSRALHTATRLPDGSVLIVGGKIQEIADAKPDIKESLDSVEMYIP